MANTIQELVRPGDRLDLVFESEKLSNDDSIDNTQYYITKVFDISEDEDLIEAFMPMEKTKLILLPVGAVYDATFYCKKGMYGCRLKVTRRFKQENLFVVEFEPLDDLKKQQRREFFRFDCVIGMNTRQLTEDEQEAFLENKNLNLLNPPDGKSVIVDISGGGMRFISADHYDVGSLVYCRFMINIGDAPKAFGACLKVIATKPVVNNKNNTEYRGSFEGMSSGDRDKIIKFIFDEERKARQRK